MNNNHQNNGHKREENIITALTYGTMIFFAIIAMAISAKFFGVTFVLFQDNTKQTISNEVQVENPGVVNVVSYAEDLEKLSTASEKIDFILKNGKSGIDYIIANPVQQSQTLGSTRDENNVILRSYINKYRSEFQIPTDKSDGYLIIVPSKMIDKKFDMYLGISGKTMGPILRTKSLVDQSEGRYVFPIKSVPIASFKYPQNLFLYADRYRKIQLGVSIGEKYNSTKQIILVFTK